MIFTFLLDNTSYLRMWTRQSICQNELLTVKFAVDLNILEDIINAKPTDGLWDDDRTDEHQLGMSYKQLEEAMENPNSKYHKKYLEIRKINIHKMKPIPFCKIKK